MQENTLLRSSSLLDKPSPQSLASVLSLRPHSALSSAAETVSIKFLHHGINLPLQAYIGPTRRVGVMRIFPAMCTVETFPHNCIRLQTNPTGLTRPQPIIHQTPRNAHHTPHTDNLMMGESEGGKDYCYEGQDKQWMGCLTNGPQQSSISISSSSSSSSGSNAVPRCAATAQH